MNAFYTVLIMFLMIFYFILTMNAIDNIPNNPTVPNCQEDEYIYYDNYPDGNLICVHVDKIR